MDLKTGRKRDRTALGVVIILASVTVMAFSDAMVKLVSADLTMWQVFVVRSLAALASIYCVLVLARIRPRLEAPVWAIVRSVLLVLTWLGFYASLPVISLSVAAVAVYTNPIITAVLSAILIGETVSGRQWGGVLLGFLGVIAILKPGTDAFSWFTILPLLAAACYSLAMVLTRSKCQNEQPLVLGLVLQATFLVVGLLAIIALFLMGLSPQTEAIFPFLLDEWAPLGVRGWAILAFLGVLSAGYFVGVARAYQIAPPPIIATFDYAYLISAALWGFVFFAETPDILTIVGMVLITAAGLMVSLRSVSGSDEAAT